VGQPNKDGDYKPGEFAPLDFRSKVCLAVNEFFRKETKGLSLEIPPITKLVKDDRQPDGVKVQLPKIEYDSLVISERPSTFKSPDGKEKDPAHFLCFFHQNGANLIGIVYQVPKKDAADAGFLSRMDYSLKSVDISEGAGAKRQDLVTRRKVRPVAKKD
jgi:hypothetical protein